ncbi:TrkA family potassium uptake protein [Spiroplasma endosymbiont of Labia minor]|uniref:potassium channel family protein n=1 Tax=Spiroplasma endosymbiont of Labia minor TaxID=3066305 RepID=UPI0030CB2AB4
MARKKSFAVIGANNFGMAVVRSLIEKKQNVVLFDQSEVKLNTQLGEFEEVDGIVLDSTSKGALEKAGITQFDGIVVSFGTSLEVSITTVLNLIDLDPNLNIIAKARDVRHKRILKAVGLDDGQVIIPDTISGKIISTRVLYDIDVDIQSAGEDFVSTKLVVREPELFGKTINEADLTANKDWSIISIVRKHKVILAENDSILQEGDKLFLFVRTSLVNELILKIQGNTEIEEIKK